MSRFRGAFCGALPLAAFAVDIPVDKDINVGVAVFSQEPRMAGVTLAPSMNGDDFEDILEFYGKGNPDAVAALEQEEHPEGWYDEGPLIIEHRDVPAVAALEVDQPDKQGEQWNDSNFDAELKADKRILQQKFGDGVAFLIEPWRKHETYIDKKLRAAQVMWSTIRDAFYDVNKKLVAYKTDKKDVKKVKSARKARAAAAIQQGVENILDGMEECLIAKLDDYISNNPAQYKLTVGMPFLSKELTKELRKGVSAAMLTNKEKMLANNPEGRTEELRMMTRVA